MTRERWEKLKEIFGEALELPPAEREPFAREAAKDDQELLSELLRLLEESDHSTARSRSASSHTTRAFLPPSSRQTLASRRPACSWIQRPVEAEPVKLTRST